MHHFLRLYWLCVRDVLIVIHSKSNLPLQESPCHSLSPEGHIMYGQKTRRM